MQTCLALPERTSKLMWLTMLTDPDSPMRGHYRDQGNTD